jgi:hypothetical protein
MELIEGVNLLGRGSGYCGEVKGIVRELGSRVDLI